MGPTQFLAGTPQNPRWPPSMTKSGKSTTFMILCLYYVPNSCNAAQRWILLCWIHSGIRPSEFLAGTPWNPRWLPNMTKTVQKYCFYDIVSSLPSKFMQFHIKVDCSTVYLSWYGANWISEWNTLKSKMAAKYNHVQIWLKLGKSTIIILCVNSIPNWWNSAHGWFVLPWIYSDMEQS